MVEFGALLVTVAKEAAVTGTCPLIPLENTGYHSAPSYQYVTSSLTSLADLGRG